MGVFLRGLAAFATLGLVFAYAIPPDQEPFVFQRPSLSSESDVYLDINPDGVLEILPLKTDIPKSYLDYHTSAEEEDAASPDSNSNSSQNPESPKLSVPPNSSLWAITYTPYTPHGLCKKPEQIQSDALSIASKGFHTIRLYSTDCSVLNHLSPILHVKSMKVIPTIYISSSGIDDSIAEQLLDLFRFGEWDMIEMIVIGNEALFYGFCSASDLADLIKQSKRLFREAGYRGPVTTVEYPEVIQENRDVICEELDVLAGAVQPYFAPDYPAEKAGDLVEEHIQDLENACSYGNNESENENEEREYHDSSFSALKTKKQTFILETGWPGKGIINGNAVAGAEEQRIAVQSILEKFGQEEQRKERRLGKITLSSFENELWRNGGEFGVEMFWGVGHLF